MTRDEKRRVSPKPAPVGKRPPRPERQAAFRLGISAESRAAAWLIAHGYRILARRWKSPLGEIDIIAARRHLLIFVEVKARAELDNAAEIGDRTTAPPHRRSGGGLACRLSATKHTRHALRCHPGGAGQAAAPYPESIRDNLTLGCGAAINMLPGSLP